MTMLNTHTSWQVGRSSGQCAACPTLLTPNTSCWAALCERPLQPHPVAASPEKPQKPNEKASEPPSPFLRVDFCEPCWVAGKRPESPLTMFSHWRTVIPVPEQKKKLLVDDSVLVDLFQRLGSRPEPTLAEEVRFRFVLALILMRKRILKYEGTAPIPAPTAEIPHPPHIWLMKLRSVEEPVHVIDPHLTPEQIGEVSGQLSAILAEEV